MFYRLSLSITRQFRFLPVGRTFFLMFRSNLEILTKLLFRYIFSMLSNQSVIFFWHSNDTIPPPSARVSGIAAYQKNFLPFLGISLFVLIGWITPTQAFAQDVIGNLDAYRYAEVDPPTKGGTLRDAIDKEDLRLTELIEELLFNKGFLLVPRDDTGRTPTYGGKLPMPFDVQKNECLNLVWFWGFAPSDPSGQTLRVTAINCRDEVVFRNSYRMYPRETVSHALRMVLDPVLRENYHFNETLNFKKFIPRVNAVKESDASFRRYLDSAETKPLEGIYKSIDHKLKEDPCYYEIGIKYIDGRYQMVVLDTDNNIWKKGEVKGYIDHAETTNLHPLSYYLSNKRKVEGFLELDDIILTVSLDIKYETFSNGSFIDSEKTARIKFIKIFPEE